MPPHFIKPGEQPPAYDEIMLNNRGGDNVRHVQTSMPWWNARYWPKKVWFGVVAGILIIVAIIIGVVVTMLKKNAYPDYTTLSYSLVDTYSGDTFFDQFNYFTGYDPTNGFVHYVPQTQAESLNLTYASSDSAVLRVDTSVGPGDSPDASTGRFSVRVESKNTYENGLFVFDIKHTPYGCGTWPALWLTDRWNWPDNGEIDVMEATNNATDGNQMTLHTTSQCKMNVKRKETGKALRKDCNWEKNDNEGCGVEADDDSYGTAFNSDGGGVMAMEWRDAGIRMWQFARGSIPSDITNQEPDPSTWGTALADFPSTNCDIGSHFTNNSIIVNIDLCGDLVYAVWDESGCSSNCSDWVANNPDEFKNAYWEFGAFHVYQSS
ncbi:concanavalin A-like lectin/glucanase domain-containing protein [Dactylonectria estremocensis]|uniref:endo-1,3(4)-beta-glucanase n=1 Tax=Dactylonectria estremocensis TaxID=1079267 RepID=A0A9P9F284_9HYPO|nr:concanavalin A-like lectin/glucanase domain-containing protein [Dactylonectria estremocensis]